MKILGKIIELITGRKKIMKDVNKYKFKIKSKDPGKLLDEMNVFELEFTRDRAETQTRQCEYSDYEEGRIFWSKAVTECNHRLNRLKKGDAA